MKLVEFQLPEERPDRMSSSVAYDMRGNIRPGMNSQADTYVIATLWGTLHRFQTDRTPSEVDNSRQTALFRVYIEDENGVDILFAYLARMVFAIRPTRFNFHTSLYEADEGEPIDQYYWYMYDRRGRAFADGNADSSWGFIPSPLNDPTITAAEERALRTAEANFYRSLVREEFEATIESIRYEENHIPLAEKLDDISENPETHEKSIPRNCPCKPCKVRVFEDVDMDAKHVMYYSYIPSGGWLFHRSDYETGSFVSNPPSSDPWRYYIGIELETDAYSVNKKGYRIEASITNELAAGLARPEEFWVAAEDGSVSGPEFKSHPATLDWWYGHRDQIGEMLTSLSHAGYRSHDTGHAGMHVNFSRSAIWNKAHLTRLMKLIHANPRWSILMSQRNIDQAEHYASLRHAIHPKALQELVEVMWANDDDDGVDKYSALNAPRGQRFEFRLPRGTLRPDRFYKNIEWVVAMIEFTRSESSSPIPSEFMEYVAQNREMYPELADFMVEKAKSIAEAIKEKVAA